MTARQPPREKGAKACTIGLYQSRDWYFCAYFSGSTGKRGAFLLVENQYKVKTDWGWMTLDEASYRDYLQGKLWINSAPRSERQATKMAPALPPNVSEEAVRLRDMAAKQGVYPLLQRLVPGGEVEVPYRTRMGKMETEEMTLSVRSSNCLMRAGATTLGKLFDLMASAQGLRSVRNLGAKSEKEIREVFFTTCYMQLTPGEQAAFWQRTLDAWNEKRGE